MRNPGTTDGGEMHPRMLMRAAAEGDRVFEYLAVNPAELELEPWPLPAPETEGMEIVEGRPGRWGRVLWSAADRRAVLLVEELEPCRFLGHHGGEHVFMLKGRVTGRPGDGGPEYAMGPGDLGWFEPGLLDEWTVEETYRKILYVAADRELPYCDPPYSER